MDRLRTKESGVLGLVVFFFFLGCGSLTGLSVLNAEYSGGYLLVFISLLFFGSLLFGKTSKVLFLLAFSTFSCVGSLIAAYLTYTTGDHFLGGGDDEYFYNLVIDSIEGRQLPFRYVISGRYKGFIELATKFYELLNLVGLKSNSYFYFILLNCFFGASIVPLTYQLGKEVTSKKTAFKAGMFLSFFPFLSYYSAVILRDIWVAFIFILVLRILFNPKVHKFFKIIYSAPLVAFSTLGIRPATGIIALVPAVAYSLIGKKYQVPRFFLAVLLFFVSIPVLDVLMVSLFKTSIFQFAEIYTALSQSTSTSSSVGLKIISSSNPIVRSTFFVISLYNPIPPFVNSGWHNSFHDIGAIAWYFMVPVSLYGMFADQKNRRIGLSLLFTLIVLLFVLFIILGSNRHRLLFVPIVVLYFFIGNSVKSRTLFYLKITHFLLLSIAFIGYFALKFL